MLSAESYSEPCQASKMESFAKIVNGSLTISAKQFILDARPGFEYASGLSKHFDELQIYRGILSNTWVKVFKNEPSRYSSN